MVQQTLAIRGNLEPTTIRPWQLTRHRHGDNIQAQKALTQRIELALPHHTTYHQALIPALGWSRNPCFAQQADFLLIPLVQRQGRDFLDLQRGFLLVPHVIEDVEHQ